jgi:hypothetical protein
MTHGGMLGAVTFTVEIMDQTGCTLQEAIAIRDATFEWEAAMSQAIAERALIPFERLH